MSLGQVGVGGRGAGASVVLVNTYWCPGLCLAKRSPCALESYVGASPAQSDPPGPTTRILGRLLILTFVPAMASGTSLSSGPVSRLTSATPTAAGPD
jgi:hypothetical protein